MAELVPEALSPEYIELLDGLFDVVARAKVKDIEIVDALLTVGRVCAAYAQLADDTMLKLMRVIMLEPLPESILEQLRTIRAEVDVNVN